MQYKWMLHCTACCLTTCTFGHDYGITELLHFLQLRASPCSQTSYQWQQCGNTLQMGREPTI